MERVRGGVRGECGESAGRERGKGKFLFPLLLVVMGAFLDLLAVLLAFLSLFVDFMSFWGMFLDFWLLWWYFWTFCFWLLWGYFLTFWLSGGVFLDVLSLFCGSWCLTAHAFFLSSSLLASWFLSLVLLQHHPKTTIFTSFLVFPSVLILSHSFFGLVVPLLCRQSKMNLPVFCGSAVEFDMSELALGWVGTSEPTKPDEQHLSS